MRLTRTILSTLSNITAIFRNEEKALRKILLLITFLRLTFKLILIRRLLNIKIKSESFLGYDIVFHDYETFWGLFTEIFLQKEYAFETDSRSPMIIDCGSNFGLAVLFFKKYYPGSKITAFEPHAETFELLKKNVFKNGLAEDVILHNAALNDAEGVSVFYSDLDKTTTTGMSLTGRLKDKGKRVKEEEVRSVLLSDFIIGQVDLLKMDIEGTETAVLRELAGKSKLGLVKEMVIEYHYDRINPGNDLAELLNLLKEEGFKYLIHAPYKPPYSAYKGKPFSLILYAYR